MYQLIKEDAFFCNGKSFDQLLGVFETHREAGIALDKYIDENLKNLNYSIIVKEV